MSLAQDRQRRRQLAEDYAARRRKFAPISEVEQQLKKLTHRLLRSEVAEAKAARRKASAATRAGSLAADLDLFTVNHG
ncbi:hypothetical protein [Ancylobacter polymorphus]|uniref:Uncharacterized protein n=1 Tax=Ancylobacter polymorphus TaxID=223390 RepID=A0A9E7CVX4_9HYPH|nr:hypothetical protein [Ancylobacter polymorphus]UOK70164.1 hypothetical protein K9D25_15705 [Ancylobacter polymorphus]